MRPGSRLVGRVIAVVVPLGAVAALLVALWSGVQTGSTNRHRVMLLGIDGGTWSVIDPLLRAGDLPALGELYQQGIHGILESRPPIISPVVWTTMFTGRLPDEHGVQNWETSQSQHRRVKALWDVTSAAGLTTHVFNVPGTFPPEQIRGVMVSGFPLSGSHIGGNTGEVMGRGALARSRGVYRHNAAAIGAQMDRLAVGAWSPWFDVGLPRPPGVRGRMKVKYLGPDAFYVSPFYRIDRGLVISHPADVRDRITDAIGLEYIPEGPGWSRHAEEETPGYLFEHLLDVSRIQTAAVAEFVDDDWDLLVYVLTLTDRVSHPYWAYMEPSAYDEIDPAKVEQYGDVVRAAHREVDRQIAELLRRATGEFYVILVSDHGFHANPRQDPAIGTHDADGIYLVWGPGLGWAEGPRVHIEDVAPTVLFLLDLPSAQDLTGKVFPVLAQTLERGGAEVASYEDGSRRGTGRPVDAETWEQLRGLGYVDDAPPEPPAE